VVLNGGDAGVEPEIEQTVAAAVRAGRPVRVAVGESTPVPAFFKQVDDLIVRCFRPDDFASFQQALDELSWAHLGYPAVVCREPEAEGQAPV
jgi:hypothetical protein